MRVAVFSQKGGSGKTTLAVHLALTMPAAAVVDCDPQGTASEWISRRTKPNPPLLISGAGASAATIEAQLPSQGHVVFDLPPAASMQTAQTLALADLVLMTVRPNFADLAALPRTLAIAQATKRKVALVVMALPLQWAESREITSALDEFKVPFYGITSQRASYARAIISGSTAAELGDRVAAREIDLLVKTILR